jgi:MFS family permease
MSPFYPIKAKEKGVSPVSIGLVFGTMAFSQMIASCVVGRSMHIFGNVRHGVIMIGTLLIVFQTASLGYLDNINDVATFLRISFIAQFFGGLGAGANSTAIMAIISSFKGAERDMYIGLIEAAFGCGLMFGPLLGAVMYSYGGYQTPFITFTFLYVFMYPITSYYLIKAN